MDFFSPRLWRPGSPGFIRARDASDADANVARAQERYDLGPLQWTAIDASATPAETLARARGALGDLID
jgi:predicted kinase